MAFEDLAEKYKNGPSKEIDDDIKRNTNQGRVIRQNYQVVHPGPPIEVPVKPFSRLAQKIIDGNPQTTDYALGEDTTFINPNQKISIRKVDLNNLGTAGKLGTGDYVLESLYLKTHKNNPDRQPINTGRVDENGNAILIPTVRAGMGNLNGLDIKGYSSDEIFYRGSDRGDEPYQIASIGSEPGDPVPNGTSRLLTFYNSDAGKNLVVRENFTQALYSNPKVYNIKKIKDINRTNIVAGIGRVATGFAAARFQPGHNALLTNLVTKRATLDIKDRRLFEIGGQSVNLNQTLSTLGTSVGDIFGGVRNRFSIDYSAQKRTGQPFGNLGDRPWNLSFLRNLPVAETRGEGPDIKGAGKFDKLRSGLAKQYNKLVAFGLKESERIQNQTTTKVTPFMDLSGGPADHNDTYRGPAGIVRAHGYDDKISNSGVEWVDNDRVTVDEFDEDIPLADLPLEGDPTKIQEGDFYVRFKDLRDGGHIYFRGYINGITENLSPSWTPTNYIGRSEPVYSYERAERDISFNLAVFPSNYTEEVYMYTKINRLTSLVYPEYMADNNGLTRMKPPFTEMYMAHIGKKQKGQFGYIKSLSYTVNESGDWNALENLPRVFNIAISYQIVNKKPPALYNQFYKRPGSELI